MVALSPHHRHCWPPLCLSCCLCEVTSQAPATAVFGPPPVLQQRKQWLELKATARRLQASIKVRASLCPTASADHPEALLMGGEDGLVHVLDASRWSRRGEQLPVVAELAGHAAPVADVAWSYDESLLASCDRAGKVVLWHRVEPSDAFFSDSFEV